LAVYLKGRYCLGEQIRTDNVIKRDLRAVGLGTVDCIPSGLEGFKSPLLQRSLYTIVCINDRKETLPKRKVKA
jgi:hypothetical protein